MRLLKILLYITVIAFGYAYFTVASFMVEKQDFTVGRGDTISSLRTKLHMDISPVLYKITTKLSYSDIILQSGTYHMEKAQKLEDFFKTTLQSPKSKDITITILPGWNIFDIDQNLAEQGIVPAGSIVALSANIPANLRKQFPFLSKTKSLEGFLSPDTYRVKPDATAEDIVTVLLNAFQNTVYNRFSFRSNDAFYDTLIFASIVEKEEKKSENKATVAGILKKRHDEKIAIGADATVCYGYSLTMKECTPAFIGEHIYEKSTYNTRQSTTLPPTPIANPSAETISATLNSESSPYYYYLHDDAGVIHYGRTLEDHNRNRMLYLRK